MEIIMEPDKEFKEPAIRMLIKLMELRNLGETSTKRKYKKEASRPEEYDT